MSPRTYSLILLGAVWSMLGSDAALSNPQQQEENPGKATCSGMTSASQWRIAKGTQSVIFTDVDTSNCMFDDTPAYLASQFGANDDHWDAKGATTIVGATETGFRVYVTNDSASSGEALRALAQLSDWRVAWSGTPQVNGDQECAGHAVPTWSSAGDKLTAVIETDCGLKGSVQHFAALSVKQPPSEPPGAVAIQALGARKFRVSVFAPDASELANSQKWGVNWRTIPADPPGVVAEETQCSGMVRVRNQSRSDWDRAHASKSKQDHDQLWERIRDRWKQSHRRGSLKMFVDTSACNFDHTPRYITSLNRAGIDDSLIGSASVIDPNRYGFWLYLKGLDNPDWREIASQWSIGWVAQRAVEGSVCQTGGLGVCAATSTWTPESTDELVCLQPIEGSPNSEIDERQGTGLDEDCDGIVDELAQQVIGPGIGTAVEPSAEVVVQVSYATNLFDSRTRGLSFSMHLDSSKITMLEVEANPERSFVANVGDIQEDLQDLDSDPSTDRYLTWEVEGNNWEGDGFGPDGQDWRELGTRYDLFQIRLQMASGFVGDTNIRFAPTSQGDGVTTPQFDTSPILLVRTPWLVEGDKLFARNDDGTVNRLQVVYDGEGTTIENVQPGAVFGQFSNSVALNFLNKSGGIVQAQFFREDRPGRYGDRTGRFAEVLDFEGFFPVVGVYDLDANEIFSLDFKTYEYDYDAFTVTIRDQSNPGTIAIHQLDPQAPWGIGAQKP